jgi:hypothetical protein
VNLLKQAKNYPFLSQINDDIPHSPLLIDGEPQYMVEEIKKARLKKMGKGNRRKVLMRWKGYKEKI